VAGLVKSIYHYGGGTPGSPYSGTVLASYVYSYDAAQQLLTERLNGSSVNTVGYDAADEVTSTTLGVTYTWDSAGNRTNAGFSQGANKGDQLATDGLWTYTYDAEGNLTGKSQKAGAPAWSFSYDNLDHLTQATYQPTGGTTSTTIVYKYDAEGRRVERDVTIGGTTTTVRYSYDQSGNEWADLNGSNALTARHFFADGTDQVVAGVQYGGGLATVSWDLTDRQGSVTGVMSNAGTLLGSRRYDAFGNVISQSGTTSFDRYGYTARESDEYTGLQYNGARWYDPVTMRWTTRDPIETASGQSNFYQYVGNDAANATDPSGLVGQSTIAGGYYKSLMLQSQYAQAYGRTGMTSDQAWQSVNQASAMGALQLTNTRPPSNNPVWNALSNIVYAYNPAPGGMMWDILTQTWQNPSNLGTLVGAGFTGLGHGTAIVGNGLTFGQIGALDRYANQLVQDKPDYVVSQAMGAVAREALIMAATGGAGNIVRAGTAAYACRTVMAARWVQTVGTGRQLYQTASSGMSAYQAYQEENYLGMAGNAALAALGGLGSASSIRQMMQSGGLSGWVRGLFRWACFAAGTPVLTPDGEKAIEDFQPGDRILSRSEHDPQGPVEVKEVVDTFVRVSLILELQVGGKVIRTTAEHPFYAADRGWLPAGQLREGDLLCSHDGSWRQGKRLPVRASCPG
jgi:RHS repeat-associated protein